VFEVLGTVLLPATQNFTKLLPTIFVGVFYVFSFYLLTFSIKDIPIHIVYATWSGLGIFSISVISVIFLKQTMPWQVTFGLFLIITGVVLVNFYSRTKLL
jgi:small multidrug resistance pump